MAAPEFGVAHAKPRAAMDPTKKTGTTPQQNFSTSCPTSREFCEAVSERLRRLCKSWGRLHTPVRGRARASGPPVPPPQKKTSHFILTPCSQNSHASLTECRHLIHTILTQPSHNSHTAFLHPHTRSHIHSHIRSHTRPHTRSQK